MQRGLLNARQCVNVAWVLVVAMLLLPAVSSAQNRNASLQQEPACQTLTPAGAGGPMPQNPSVMVLRWLANANVELAYRDVVILMDTYFDAPREFPLGVTRKDFKRVTAILIGHAHDDHISDAADIAQRTGAPVIGAPISTDFVRSLGLPERLTRPVKGGESIAFNGFKVRPVLGRHSNFSAEDRARIAAVERALAVPPRELTEAEKRMEEGIRGSRDPKMATEGTMSFLLEFDNGFRLIYVDSPGSITEEKRQLMREIPNTDVGIFPYSVHPIVSLGPFMDYVRLFKPGLVLPVTLDRPAMPTFDLFSTIRKEFPKTKMVSPIYHTPVCINTDTKEVYVGQY